MAKNLVWFLLLNGALAVAATKSTDDSNNGKVKLNKQQKIEADSIGIQPLKCEVAIPLGLSWNETAAESGEKFLVNNSASTESFAISLTRDAGQLMRVVLVDTEISRDRVRLCIRVDRTLQIGVASYTEIVAIGLARKISKTDAQTSITHFDVNSDGSLVYATVEGKYGFRGFPVIGPSKHTKPGLLHFAKHDQIMAVTYLFDSFKHGNASNVKLHKIASDAKTGFDYFNSNIEKSNTLPTNELVEADTTKLKKLLESFKLRQYEKD